MSAAKRFLQEIKRKRAVMGGEDMGKYAQTYLANYNAVSSAAVASGYADALLAALNAMTSLSLLPVGGGASGGALSDERSAAALYSRAMPRTDFLKNHTQWGD